MSSPQVEQSSPSSWRRISERFAALGATPGEDASASVARRTLLLGGLLMSGGGILWGTIALSAGLVAPAAIPIGYVVLTAINYATFARTREFRWARFIQVFISLVLPFAFQWALGGYASSGVMMLWAMVSIVGALTFSEAKETLFWLAIYIVLTIFSGGLDSYFFARSGFTPGATARVVFLVINVVAVSGVVFGVAIYLNVIRARALRLVESANADNVALNARLATEVEERGVQLEELRALQARLAERTEALTRSLDELRQTQAELVQREKLAALGQLVAGVAHEINTPLGVSYTGVTLALERVSELERALGGAPPSRRQLLELIGAGREALQVAATNAERAASLIANFKRVAVDQTSEAEREIELLAYLGAIAGSLSPMLREAHAELRCEGVPVTLVTRPGAIAQVVTNLVQNALVHAFTDAHAQRVVTLRCGPDGDHACLQVIDAGVGMGEELAKRVFEPFVTTRRGAGGSGLGMHIVHQQVYEALGGTITLDTAPGRGTRVAIRLPLALRAGPGTEARASAIAPR
jgi:signal transduction histidine kinase